MAEPKAVAMTAITRVGHGGGKTALPGQEFDIAESEVSRLEALGAAKRKAVVEPEAPKAPKQPKKPKDPEETKGD